MASASAGTSAGTMAGIGDLGDSIERVKCHGLNISAGKPIMNLFIGDERAPRARRISSNRARARERSRENIPRRTFLRGVRRTFLGGVRRRLCCVSEDDEQMIINIEFKEAVCIHSINLCAPDDDTAPEDVKLFVNKPNIGFSDCEDGPCEHKMSMTAEDLVPDKVVALKVAKFNFVNSLTIYVSTNRGADVTSLSSLKLNGKTRESTNMANFKKVG